MASRTTYLENAWLNHVLRNTAFTSPTTVYVGLIETLTDGEASSFTEVSGGSYARQAITFGAPSDGVCANNSDIEFIGMPAVTVSAVGIFDADTAGNMLYYVDIVDAAYDAGSTARISAGDVTVTAT